MNREQALYILIIDNSRLIQGLVELNFNYTRERNVREKNLNNIFTDNNKT